MGHKVNPVGMRLGINRTWDSRWFGDQDYAGLLAEDLKLRAYLEKRLQAAGISRIVIERPAKKARVMIHTARPGVVIGKKGQDIEALRRDLSKMSSAGDVALNIVEIRKPELDAKLVAENIAQQLQRRVTFRRAMKRAVQSAMRLGAEGEIPQDAQGPQCRLGEGRHRVEFRRLRHEGDRGGAGDRAPDRGRPAGDDAVSAPPGARLDPDLSGSAGVGEAGRGPHG